MEVFFVWVAFKAKWSQVHLPDELVVVRSEVADI